MPTLSEKRKDRLLAELVSAPAWVGLAMEDEAEVGQRQQVSFGEPRAKNDVRYVQNDELVRFPTLQEDAASLIVYWLLAESQTGGDVYLLVKLAEPREARRGNAPIFEIGDLTIAIP